MATKKKTMKKPAAKKPAQRKAKNAGTDEAVRARVTVSPRPEIPDPEGEAIRDALNRLGFEQVSEVRAGRSFEIALAGVGEDAAPDLLRRMCDELLIDSVAEEPTFELLGAGGGGKP